MRPIVSLMCIMLCMVIFTAIAVVASYLIAGDTAGLNTSYNSLILTQAITCLLMFVGTSVASAPFAIGSVRGMFGAKSLTWRNIAIAVGAIIACQPLVEWASFVNQSICDMPQLQSAMAAYKEQEALSNSLLAEMLVLDTPLRWCTTIVVIAILPAIGEEMFFRGIVQPTFKRLTNSNIAAIIVTAALFSFFHMQPSAFLPRLLLGAILGILAIYGKSLTLPIIVHAINNLAVIIWTATSTDKPIELLSQPTENPGAIVPIASLLITVVLLKTLIRQPQTK